MHIADRPEMVKLYQEDGTTLFETAGQESRGFVLRQGNGEQIFSQYDASDLTARGTNMAPYFHGHSITDVLRSGRDILGEEALAQAEWGEPSFEQIRAILPPVTHDAYCFLGGALSWGSVTVDRMGQICPQSWGRDHHPAPVFRPIDQDLELGVHPPVQKLLGGCLPVLTSVFTDGRKVMEILCFVEPADPDRDPLVWLRVRYYPLDAPMDVADKYLIASASRNGTIKTEPELFWEALCSTLIYWSDYTAGLACFILPEKQLQQTATGTMVSLATTFSGDHTHYGHREYGWEAQDHFPPVIIWSVEACCVQGKPQQAARYLQYLFTYSVDHLGRFVYRQGQRELRGVSASEYGQLLFLLERYSKAMCLWDWMKPFYPKLAGMGRELLRHRTPCEECGGNRLIRMCAEADTNGRIFVYTSNNLWAVRGLRSLARLMREYGDDDAAAEIEREANSLWRDLRAALDEAKEASPYGPMVPFRFGYTAQPITLSSSDEPLAVLSAKERQAYFIHSDMRVPAVNQQDYLENTYANYRYYLEMLSSMLLNPQEGDAIVLRREHKGGELLGMTRLFARLDDWPVKHYARYLIETGRIGKYLLLLSAHTAHHGHADLLCYYEQVTADGCVMASDCVPSLLTTPIMVGWMFAFEPMDKPVLQLLRAIPKAWFRRGFSAGNIGTSRGNLSITVDRQGETIRIVGNLENLTSSGEIELWVRGLEKLMPASILSGGEAVQTIQEQYLVLKSEARTFDITLR